jgi:hypothetical protein
MQPGQIVKVRFDVADVKRNRFGEVKRGFLKSGNHGELVRVGEGGRLFNQNAYCMCIPEKAFAKKQILVEGEIKGTFEKYSIVCFRDKHGQTVELVVDNDYIKK